jgi:hypothetical protein
LFERMILVVIDDGKTFVLVEPQLNASSCR